MRRLLCTLVGVITVALPIWADQTAGSVKALIPAATRNAQPVAVNQTLLWNDLLQTDAKGRLRAGLTDGSVLSLGSNSQLKVVQHDASSQQTALDLNYGKLRNQVTKITRPDGKYQVKTANAVIGVIGTDFYVDYLDRRTTVICYQGSVSVTPTGGAKIIGGNGASTGGSGTIVLSAGQIAIIGMKPETQEPQLFAILMSSMAETDIPNAGMPSGPGPADSHPSNNNVGAGSGTAPAEPASRTPIESASSESGKPISAPAGETHDAASTMSASPEPGQPRSVAPRKNQHASSASSQSDSPIGAGPTPGGTASAPRGERASAAPTNSTSAQLSEPAPAESGTSMERERRSPVPSQTRPPVTQSQDDTQLIALINQTRAENGVPPLNVDPRLTEAARKHTLLMVQYSGLSHQFPGEPALPDRCDQENLASNGQAENVAWDVNVVSAHHELVSDPPHLRNIIDPAYTVVGVAVVRIGKHIFVTEDFAHLLPEDSQAQH